MTRRWNAGLAAAAALTVLLGVTACTADAQPSAKPEPTVSTGTTPAAASSADPTDPADWVISRDGVGPFTRGGSITAAKALVGPSYTLQPAESCPNPVMSIFMSPSHPTIWVQSQGFGSDRVYLVYVGSDPADTEQTAGTPKTKEGIGIGSSLEAVMAAYPAGYLDADDNLGEKHYFSDDPKNAPDTGSFPVIVFGISDNLVRAISVQDNTQYLNEFCG
ncbi:hypothetical protein BH09ACT1_BH09ACT1_29800 [soil metagenome]